MRVGSGDADACRGDAVGSLWWPASTAGCRSSPIEARRPRTSLRAAFFWSRSARWRSEVTTANAGAMLREWQSPVRGQTSRWSPHTASWSGEAGYRAEASYGKSFTATRRPTRLSYKRLSIRSGRWKRLSMTAPWPWQSGTSCSRSPSAPDNRDGCQPRHAYVPEPERAYWRGRRRPNAIRPVTLLRRSPSDAGSGIPEERVRDREAAEESHTLTRR
jgi:hypothetical protein